MKKKIRKLFELTRLAKNRSVSLRRRLTLYWAVMLLTVCFFMLFLLSFTGAFSHQERELKEYLEYQLSYMDSSLSHQIDDLTAQSLALSRQLSSVLTQQLEIRGKSVKDLNDQPDMLEQLQRAFYEKLSATLQIGECSGVYAVLDATVNTSLESAAKSRSGMYLRYANVKGRNTTGKDVVYFRGMPGIARSEHLELHNRWELEFDVSRLPGYETMMTRPVKRLANSYAWTACFTLPQTWERVMLLSVPILDGSGKPCGVCGVEISSLYFSLSYPAPDSRFGKTIFVFAPVSEDMVEPGEGMVSSDVYMDDFPRLKASRGRYFNYYQGTRQTYAGLHRRLETKDTEGKDLGTVLLLSERSFHEAARAARLQIASVFFMILLLLLALSFYLTWRFASPISRSLEAIRNGASSGGQKSGVSEIDTLMEFLQTKAAQRTGGNELPPEIGELLCQFSSRSQKLTAAERSVLRYYAQGLDAAQIMEKACISMSTVRKHSGNLYRKLQVASRDELMLVIDLFRRCGRLEELLGEGGENSPKNQQTER